MRDTFKLPPAIYGDGYIGMTQAHYDARAARLAEAERLLRWWRIGHVRGLAQRGQRILETDAFLLPTASAPAECECDAYCAKKTDDPAKEGCYLERATGSADEVQK